MDRKEHRSSADNVSGQDKVSKLMNAPAPYLVKTVKEKGKIQKSIRVKLISNDDSKRENNFWRDKNEKQPEENFVISYKYHFQ